LPSTFPTLESIVTVYTQAMVNEVEHPKVQFNFQSFYTQESR
jgi:hypothetical protein